MYNIANKKKLQALAISWGGSENYILSYKKLWEDNGGNVYRYLAIYTYLVHGDEL